MLLFPVERNTMKVVLTLCLVALCFLTAGCEFTTIKARMEGTCGEMHYIITADEYLECGMCDLEYPHDGQKHHCNQCGEEF